MPDPIPAAPAAPGSFFTAAQVTDIVKGAVTDAIKAINTVDPNERPGASKSVDVPNINRNRTRRPSFGKAIYAAMAAKSWTGYELERDLSQAAKDMFLPEAGPNSIVMPTTPFAYYSVLEETEVKTEAYPALKEWAVKALAEGVNSVTYANTTGSQLVVPQFLQDEFVLILTSTVAVRSVPSVRSLPVTGNVVLLPRENTQATTAAVAEAGTLTSADPAFTQQSFTIQKQYGYRTYSNELLRDSNPAIDSYISRTLVRDIALFQDLQFLEGSGSGSNLTGIRNYSGLTTSSWTAATNGSTPVADDLIKMIFDIRKANTEPDAWIMHPRTLQNIVLLKDASGRYIFTDNNVWGGPVLNPASGTNFSYPGRAVGTLLGKPVYLSTQISTTQTQGTSSLASYIILGNFSYCVILERQALEIATSEHVAFNTDQTAVRGLARSAIALTQPKAFSVSTGIL